MQSTTSTNGASTAWANAFALMRVPFSIYLMPMFWLAVAMYPRAEIGYSVQVFFILHLLLYPASNGFNSYHDRDTGPVGGLAAPPPPNKQLFWLVALFDVAALVWAWTLGLPFFNWVLVYTLASKAYSWPRIRLKADAVLGTATVVILQGAGTYIMVLAGLQMCSCEFNNWWHWLAAAGASITLLGNYPLTQVYQHEQDAAAGDMTLSRKLGLLGTFRWAQAFMAIGGVMVGAGLYHTTGLAGPIALLVAQAPALIHFQKWQAAVAADSTAANHKNAMRMNQLASLGFSLALMMLVAWRTLI